MTARSAGVTTGQAARYCLVTPDTIVNWIKADNLPAQRTLGGQYRILVADLRQFMVCNEMSTALLDAELDCRPYCWEVRCTTRAHPDPREAVCGKCPVFRAKALNCFEFRAVSDEQSWAHPDCHDCPYFHKWAAARSDE